jgi:hypothetical protein
MTVPFHVLFPALLAIQAPAARGTNPMLPLLIQMGAIVAIFYFLMIRPQQKQRRQHEDRLRKPAEGRQRRHPGWPRR